MADYSFVTTWRFRATIDAVWEAIMKPSDWPRWWPSVRSVRRLKEGDADGLGTVDELVVKGRLPYTLRFTMTSVQVQRPVVLEGKAAGELEGRGRWQLQGDSEETIATYYWDVRTSGLLLNLLAPIARPIFAWNHDQVMKEGHQGLVRWLSSRKGEGVGV